MIIINNILEKKMEIPFIEYSLIHEEEENYILKIHSFDKNRYASFIAFNFNILAFLNNGNMFICYADGDEHFISIPVMPDICFISMDINLKNN